MANENKNSDSIKINIGGNANNSTVIASSGNVNIQQESRVEYINITEFFAEVYTKIQNRPEDTNVDKEEITQTVEKIEGEINKDEEANSSKIQRWLNNLGKMAPDIFDVVVSFLSNPQAGITTVIQKIAKKAKEEFAK